MYQKTSDRKSYEKMKPTNTQVGQVMNGMSLREFRKLYGDSVRTQNLYYKIRNMKSLGVSSQEVLPETDVLPQRKLGGKVVNVGNTIYKRGELLLKLYDGESKRLNVSSCLLTLIKRDYIHQTEKKGFYQITDRGRDYLETILDDQRGWCHILQQSFPKDQMVLGEKGWEQHRMSTISQSRFRRKPLGTTHKVKAVSLWTKIKSLIPRITISFQQA